MPLVVLAVAYALRVLRPQFLFNNPIQWVGSPLADSMGLKMAPSRPDL